MTGVRMPPEWAPHERTIMCWPAREVSYAGGAAFEQAKADYATTANAVAAFEPVLMAVHPAQEAEARAALTAAVDVVAMPIDDAWARDTGPIFVRRDDGTLAGTTFAFNAWGEKFTPWDEDARFAGRVLEHLGAPRLDARPFVLEGGSVAVDGAGLLVTTEQCLLHPRRNPSLSREEIEARLREHLGAERVVWCGLGLVEDDDTDGHVDNIVAFHAPAAALLQTVADPADPNHEHCLENRARLEAAGIAVTELGVLPAVAGEDPPVRVPYVNFYVCNGGVVVPLSDPETDDHALGVIGGLFADREVVGIPGVSIALGGGGVHCITQQVPAASPGSASAPGVDVDVVDA